MIERFNYTLEEEELNEILQENEDRGVWTYVEYDGGDTIIETTDPSDYGIF